MMKGVMGQQNSFMTLIGVPEVNGTAVLWFHLPIMYMHDHYHCVPCV